MSVRSSEWLETSSSRLATPGRLPWFYLFPRTLPPAPKGEESLGLGDASRAGAAPISSDKELWAPPPGRGVLSGERSGTSARDCEE